MKKNLFVLFLLLAVFGCKKSSSDATITSTYFFKCQVDGKTIDLSYVPNTSGLSSNGVMAIAGASNTIITQVTSSQCSTPGSYCITHNMTIIGQVVGTYKPSNFELQTTIGGTFYFYNYSYLSPNTISLSVNITKIEHGNTPNTGHLEGTFSGTVEKTQSNVLVNTIVPITGSFSLPLP